MCLLDEVYRGLVERSEKSILAGVQKRKQVQGTDGSLVWTFKSSGVLMPSPYGPREQYKVNQPNEYSQITCHLGYVKNALVVRREVVAFVAAIREHEQGGDPKAPLVLLREDRSGNTSALDEEESVLTCRWIWRYFAPNMYIEPEFGFKTLAFAYHHLLSNLSAAEMDKVTPKHIGCDPSKLSKGSTGPLLLPQLGGYLLRGDPDNAVEAAVRAGDCPDPKSFHLAVLGQRYRAKKSGQLVPQKRGSPEQIPTHPGLRRLPAGDFLNPPSRFPHGGPPSAVYGRSTGMALNGKDKRAMDPGASAPGTRASSTAPSTAQPRRAKEIFNAALSLRGSATVASRSRDDGGDAILVASSSDEEDGIATAAAAVRPAQKRFLFLYHRVEISDQDKSRLEPKKYFNDVLIDFYLKFSENARLANAESGSSSSSSSSAFPPMHKKVHVFGSYFFTKLSEDVPREVGEGMDTQARRTAEAWQRYARVQRWTKNVNIFALDMLLVPVCVDRSLHWSLAAICNPGAFLLACEEANEGSGLGLSGDDSVPEVEDGTQGSVPEHGGTGNPREGSNDLSLAGASSGGGGGPVRRGGPPASASHAAPQAATPEEISAVDEAGAPLPCILFFDSLGLHDAAWICALLREYLNCLIAARNERQAVDAADAAAEGATEPGPRGGSNKRRRDGTTKTDGQPDLDLLPVLEEVFTEETLPLIKPPVPMQDNTYDCGVFVLAYADAVLDACPHIPGLASRSALAALAAPAGTTVLVPCAERERVLARAKEVLAQNFGLELFRPKEDIDLRRAQLLKLVNFLTQEARSTAVDGVGTRSPGGLGPLGIKNLGNTCYMSTGLQCLLATPELPESLLSSPAPVSEVSRTFTELAQQVDGTRAPSHILDPSKFLAAVIGKFIGWKSLRKNRQEDCHEFILRFIEATDEMVAQGIFGGTWLNSLRCDVCSHLGQNTEDFKGGLCLPLAGGQGSTEESTEASTSGGPRRSKRACVLKKLLSLTQCLEAYFREEQLETFTCPGCGADKGQQTWKKIQLSVAPPVLMIQLKRFEQRCDLRGRPNGTSKDCSPVAIDAGLDLRSFAGEGTNAAEDADYTLFAVVLHCGASMSSGHYIALVLQHQVWWKCDDDKVGPYNESELTQENGPYLLFYQKKSDQSGSADESEEDEWEPQTGPESQTGPGPDEGEGRKRDPAKQPSPLSRDQSPSADEVFLLSEEEEEDCHFSPGAVGGGRGGGGGGQTPGGAGEGSPPAPGGPGGPNTPGSTPSPSTVPYTLIVGSIMGPRRDQANAQDMLYLIGLEVDPAWRAAALVFFDPNEPFDQEGALFVLLAAGLI